MKKILSLFFIFLVSTLLVAFSWPWEKEKEPSPTPQAVSPVRQEAREESTAEKDLSTQAAKPVQGSQVSPKTQKATRLLARMKKADAQVKPQFIAPQTVSKSFATPRISAIVPDPSVVSSEIQQVIQLNKKRQMELTRQIQVLNETTKRAKLYNKILNNMYPPAAARNLTARAVTQEKVKLIHQEIKKLGVVSVQTVPTIPSANQAKAIAARSSQAGLLPIGRNQKQS